MKIFIKNEQELRKLLLIKGFSQRSLARKAAISEPYIYQIISGDRNPSGKTANRICKALNVDFEDIFFIKDAYKSKII